MSFVTHEQQSLVWLASPLLGGVRHGFSTRRGGVSPAPWDTLNLGPGRGDAPENVEENYRRFFAALDMDSAYPVLSRQVHRDDVRLCTAADAGKGLIRDRDYDADALITAEKGLPLVVFSADCGILLLHDPDAGCVGAVHAGVAPEHIDICGLCTACRPDLFWSHRKMGEARGAQVAVICL